MRLREDDINFLKIDGRLFEEMCFDLLRRLGFHAIVWRQGGADHGRDIEGRFTSANPLIGTSTESWFFECKNQATGVSVADLCDKLQWADAEKPDHFVILAGSHLTNDCRTWLAKISADKRYRLHVVEGKELNRLVRAYPELVERYFAGPYELLLRDLIRQFLLVGILPSPEQMHSLWANLNPADLAPEEFAFLWITWRLREDEIDSWIEDNEPFSFSHYLPLLRDRARPGQCLLAGRSVKAINTSWKSLGGTVFEIGTDGRLGKVIGPIPRVGVLAGENFAQIILNSGKGNYHGLHAYVEIDQSWALEILVEGGHTLTSSIRSIAGGFDGDQKAALWWLQPGG